MGGRDIKVFDPYPRWVYTVLVSAREEAVFVLSIFEDTGNVLNNRRLI